MCVFMLRPDLSSSLLSYEDPGPQGSRGEADSREKDVTRGAGTGEFAASSLLSACIPTPSPGTLSGYSASCGYHSNGPIRDIIHPAEPPIDTNK